MTVVDSWIAPDFLGFDDARSAARLVDRSDVLFECTHFGPTGGGGVTVSRDAVLLHQTDEVIEIAPADVVGWSVVERRQFTVVTLWTGRPARAHRTTVLRRFAAAVRSAMLDVLGDERPA